MSQSGSLTNATIIIPGNVPQSFVTDSGTAVPASNILDVFGANGIQTTGASNIVTIKNNPVQNVFQFEDFVNGVPDPNLWFYNTQSSASSSTNPGQTQFADTATNWIGTSAINSNSNNGPYIVGGGTISLNWVFDIGTLAGAVNNYVAYIGFSIPAQTVLNTAASLGEGIYFKYTHGVNSDKWQLISNNGAMTTTVNSTTLAAIGFHNYGISINAAGTLITFTIDGTSIGTINTNIPTDGLAPLIYSLVTAGALPTQSIDLMTISQNLTVSR